MTSATLLGAAVGVCVLSSTSAWVQTQMPVAGPTRTAHRRHTIVCSSNFDPRLKRSSPGAKNQQTKPNAESELLTDKIVYDAIYGTHPNTVVYLPALEQPNSDLKAAAVQRYCRETSHTYLSMDWVGVGRSGGEFREGTITRYKQDAIELIEKMALYDKECVLVGCGVGAWVSLLIALERPELVTGLVGIAADPDFTENLLWKYLPEEKKSEIMEQGSAIIRWGSGEYEVTRDLIEDGRNNLLLEGPPRGLDIGDKPVRLIHSMVDEEVPYTVSLALAQRLSSRNVVVSLLKAASHHMTDVQDYKYIKWAVQDCCEHFSQYDLTSPASG